MRDTFQDSKLEKQFIRHGYVTLPFLDTREVDALQQAFFESLPMRQGAYTPQEYGFGKDVPGITYDFTFIDRNVDYKQNVFDTITHIFMPKLDQILGHYKPIIANYIRKVPGGGEVPLHQNWAFVDETSCTSVSIWCPLVDSTKTNGTLEVIPGSHKRFGRYRGPKIPWELDDIGPELIDTYMTPLETKAGDCVILDDSILHYSQPNLTENLRLAIQLILIPTEVLSLHHHYQRAPGEPEVQILEVSPEFYMSYNPWQEPTHVKPIDTIKYRPYQLSLEEFRKQLTHPSYERRGVWEKIRMALAS